MPATQLPRRQTLREVQSRLLAMPAGSAVAVARDDSPTGEVLRLRDRLLRTVVDVTSMTAENEMAAQGVQADTRRLEAELRREEIQATREEMVDARRRRRELDETERLARIEALRNPPRHESDEVRLMREQLAALQQRLEGQQQAVLMQQIEDLKARINSGTAANDPASLMSQMQTVLAFSDQVRTMFGARTTEDDRTIELRQAALEHQQELERDAQDARLRREEEEWKDELEERAHRREMQKAKGEQLDNFLAALGPIFTRALGGEGAAAALGAPAQAVLPAPRAEAITTALPPGVREDPCPICGTLVPYLQGKQNIATCPGCRMPMELQNGEDEEA